MSISVAYVATGKLHLKYDGAVPRPVESKFAHEVRERLMRVAQRNAWKTQGTGAQFMHGRLMNSRLLWGQDAEDEDGVVMSVRSLTRGTERGQILFALGGQGVNGLFSFDPETLNETRVVHGADHLYDDLALDRNHQLVACSTPRRDGSSSIAVMSLTPRITRSSPRETRSISIRAGCRASGGRSCSPPAASRATSRASRAPSRRR